MREIMSGFFNYFHKEGKLSVSGQKPPPPPPPPPPFPKFSQSSCRPVLSYWITQISLGGVLCFSIILESLKYAGLVS